ncbi:hypothetical protein [Paraferrimonas haliotis]|uniref:Uncharacterized protein n=1 Tax=Paraferrimonas haliotis TaxID=2013866 RepID=A0AA37TQA6_9GAMM|nr:hypothetical protein [Paraferrimonas haliotis]GLS83693.1 hypothetical protein GCM10007894_16700 [Paraferrimonas haliotis]
MKKSLLSLALIPLIYACGSDSSDDPQVTPPVTPPPTEEPLESGVLLDSAVINIGYTRTTEGGETISGVTDDDGTFEYEVGDSIVFTIGAVSFPSVTPAAILTPLEIFAAESALDPAVLNAIRLLQTLDQDGDPSNGITITDTAKESATSAIDFTQSVEDFENSAEVIALISSGGQDEATVELVSGGDALAHFNQTLQQNELSDVAFEADFINDKRFAVWGFEHPIASILLSSDGSGEAQYAPTESNNYALDQTMMVSWQVDESGRLSLDFGSDDSASNWLITPIEFSDDSDAVEIALEASGASDEDDFSEVAQLLVPAIDISGQWQVSRMLSVCPEMMVDTATVGVRYDENSGYQADVDYQDKFMLAIDDNQAISCQSVMNDMANDALMFEEPMMLSLADLNQHLGDDSSRFVQTVDADTFIIFGSGFDPLQNAYSYSEYWTRTATEAPAPEPEPIELQGTWYQKDGSDSISIITFVDDEVYLQADFDPQGHQGMEWGLFALSGANELYQTSDFYDDNDSAGLSDAGVCGEQSGGDVVVVESTANNELSLSVTAFEQCADEQAESDSVVFMKLAGSDSLVGTWVYDSGENLNSVESFVLAFTFFDDGNYVHYEVNPEGEGGAGMEFGQYSVDSETSELLVSAVNDLNGDIGLNPESDALITVQEVTATRLTLEVTEDGATEQLFFNRVN